MREIKFRGKRLDNGEWAFGDYSRYSKEHSLIMVDLLEQEEYWVSSETVGQYTGLHDKNGAEIYEGDVLRNVDNLFVDKLPLKVEWNEHCGAWFWCSSMGETSYFLGTDRLYQHIAKNCEVIGNIHEKEKI